MANKKVVRKPVDPWGGAAHSTGGFGAGSTPVLQAIQAAAPPPAPDPNAAAKAQYATLIGGATNIAGTTYGNTLADSIAGEGTAALDIGATLTPRDPGADPSAATQGSIDWNNVEASNPFSRAALMVRNYHQQQNRTTNGLAARGQLYSGAYLNQQGQDTFGFQGGQNDLTKTLTNYLAGQGRIRRDAGVTKDTTINTAGLTGLQTLLGS